MVKFGPSAMTSASLLNSDIVRTLLYYEIFDHPLTAHELFHLLPRNSISERALREELDSLSKAGILHSEKGFYSMNREGSDLAMLRERRAALAGRRLRIAKAMSHVIKRFPFVRAIFISGDLSKGVASPQSDIDYVIVTEPGRLWICRSMLVAFKKVLLLNSKKYFCLNYYVDTLHLALDEHNYYTATEIAHLMPLFNGKLYLQYMNANAWIRGYFPNYRIFAVHDVTWNDRRSFLQHLLELPIRGRWAAGLERALLEYMKRTWKSRYPEYDDATRERIFRSSASESRAYVGNFSDKVLSLYRRKLEEHAPGGGNADPESLSQ
jgi:DNA-binding transcriptional ArsR family regulator